jgi:hypothetical protein
MSETIIIAALSLVGTLAGTFGGILTSNRLIGYRIEQLEKKVEKHNNLIDRMYRVEERTELQEQRLNTIEHNMHEINR